MEYIFPAGKSEGRIGIVDDDMRHLSLERWYLTSHGYMVSKHKNYLHHAVIGKPPAGLVVDHLNRNKLDNRRANLRFVSTSTNVSNCAVRSNSKSGIKGVRKHRRKWVAEGCINYKTIYLGIFDTPQEAQEARMNWESTVAAMGAPF